MSIAKRPPSPTAHARIPHRLYDHVSMIDVPRPLGFVRVNCRVIGFAIITQTNAFPTNQIMTSNISFELDMIEFAIYGYALVGVYLGQSGRS